jgi:hypothetical protein
MKTQIMDQTGKGAVLALVAYGFRSNPELAVVLIPAISAAMAWASTLVGNPNIASFFDKATKELAKVAEQTVAKKK